MGRNSENSSKPPSQDPIAPRQSRAERRRAAREVVRRQGKQPGAPGASLARREPDEVVRHAPVRCQGCGRDLSAAEVVGKVVRQVLDVPPVSVIAIDHVAERRRCACGHETVGTFPPAARAPVCWGPEIRALAVYLMDRQHLPLERTAELLAELLDAPVSTGWLYSVQAEAAGRLSEFVAVVRAGLAAAPVLHADETGTRVGTAKAWVHTLTTNLLTLLVVHPKRGREAMEDIGVLGEFAGTLVHDGFASYDVFTGITHAQCGAHLVRHLASAGKRRPLRILVHGDDRGSWCRPPTSFGSAAAREPLGDRAALRARFQQAVGQHHEHRVRQRRGLRATLPMASKCDSRPRRRKYSWQAATPPTAGRTLSGELAGPRTSSPRHSCRRRVDHPVRLPGLTQLGHLAAGAAAFGGCSSRPRARPRRATGTHTASRRAVVPSS